MSLICSVWRFISYLSSFYCPPLAFQTWKISIWDLKGLGDASNGPCFPQFTPLASDLVGGSSGSCFQLKRKPSPKAHASESSDLHQTSPNTLLPKSLPSSSKLIISGDSIGGSHQPHVPRGSRPTLEARFPKRRERWGGGAFPRRKARAPSVVRSNSQWTTNKHKTENVWRNLSRHDPTYWKPNMNHQR